MVRDSSEEGPRSRRGWLRFFFIAVTVAALLLIHWYTASRIGMWQPGYSGKVALGIFTPPEPMRLLQVMWLNTSELPREMAPTLRPLLKRLTEMRPFVAKALGDIARAGALTRVGIILLRIETFRIVAPGVSSLPPKLVAR